MNLLAKSLLPLAILAVPALAGIDSGGATVNHSSIGEPSATLTTLGCPTLNHPGLIEVLYPDTPVTPASISGGNGNGQLTILKELGIRSKLQNA